MARRVQGEWEYPPLDQALERAGLWPMKEYIRRRQATIEEYIATRPIFELCTGHNRSATSRATRWWHQDHTLMEEEQAAVDAANADANDGADDDIDDVEDGD